MGIDWYSAADASAYDLSVSDEHNYFITANQASEPVLVHNQTENFFCGVKIKNVDIVDELLAVQARLDGDVVGDVTQVLAKLDEGEVDEVLAVIGTRAGAGSADDLDRAARIAANLATENGGLIASRALEVGLLDEVLGGRHFADVVDDLDGAEALIGSVGRSGLTELSSRAFARLVFDSPDAALMVRNASLDVVLTDRALAADVVALAAGEPAEIAEVFLLHQNLDRVVSNRAGVTEVLVALEDEAVELAKRNVELGAQSNALIRLNDAEVAAGAGAHGSSRHNAGTRLIDHYRRIGTGQRPDGGFDDTIQTQSGRAISHDDYAAAVDRAIAVTAARAAQGDTRLRSIFVRFADERQVGEVVIRNGSGVAGAGDALGDGVVKWFEIRIGQRSQWTTTRFLQQLPGSADPAAIQVLS